MLLMVLFMKVQLVGDLYGCAFKLCILHITGETIPINSAGKYEADILK